MLNGVPERMSAVEHPPISQHEAEVGGEGTPRKGGELLRPVSGNVKQRVTRIVKPLPSQPHPKAVIAREHAVRRTSAEQLH